MIATSTPRRGIYGALDRALRILELGAAVIGGGVMVLAMVMTSLDAILRYLFNAPITFNAYLTTYYFMVAMLIMPMAWAFRNGGYIRFVFVASRLPPAAGQMLLRMGKLVGAAYFAALAWLAWRRFHVTWVNGDVQMGEIDWPVSWSWIWIPVGLGLLSLRLVLMTFGPTEELHYADWLNDASKDEPV